MSAVSSLRRSFGALAAGVAMTVAAVSSQAAFLRNIPQTLTQPDGTAVNLYATGDEYFNRLHDADGFTVVRDPDTGFLVYAIKADGRLQPTGFVVGRVNPTEARLEPGLMPDPWTLPSPEETYPFRSRLGRVQPMGISNAPRFTAINNIVIFISFSDETTPNFKTADSYQSVFNTSATSMKQYFLEASYGRLTVNSTFYPPPSGGTVVSFKDSHARSYYLPYAASTNPNGYAPGQRAEREWAMLQAAANFAASRVPASLNVDTDGDGYVDSVVFVISGRAAQADWSNLLWPHKWTLDEMSFPARIHGKLVGDYDFQLDKNIPGSGVLCHEMTHTLGAPDLYHYSDCSTNEFLDPVGPWDLMDQDTDPPQHTTAYLKWRYLGFISDIPLITPPATVTLHPLSSGANSCARFASPNSPTEYFVVEYRHKSLGNFEAALPSSGLLVYRINTVLDGEGNVCGPPDELYVYRPGGTPTAQGNIYQAAFNGAAVPPRTAINDSTDPSCFLSNGVPGGLSIHDIGLAGDTITFQVDNPTVCEEPGPFSLTSPADGSQVAAAASIALAWAPAVGATSYEVHFGTDPNPPILGTHPGTGVTVDVAAGSNYFWYVVATNACGQISAPGSGAWSFGVAGQAQPSFVHWIPAVIHKDVAAKGAWWRSDVAVLNRSSVPGTLTLNMHAPSGTKTMTVPIAGNAQVLLRDVAGQLGVTADSGALEVVPDVDVFVSGRTYNQVDATHTYGQDYNGQAPSEVLAAGGTAWLPQLAENAAYRTNVGITNTGTATANVTVTLYDSAGVAVGWTKTRDYAPGEFVQYQQPYSEVGGIDSGYGVVTVNSGAGVVAYASVTDQQTNDPTTINMKTGAAGAVGPFVSWLPAVVHKDVASMNAQWRSDVAVLNRTAVAGSLTVNIHVPSGTEIKALAVPIRASAQVVLRDVAALLGVTADSGALEVVADVDVFVTSRTYNQVDATHTYGQGYEGRAPSELLSAGSRAWLPQLTENALYRTNVGITNTGTTTANVTVTLYDSAGAALDWTRTRAYAPGEFVQYQQPYLAVGGIDSGYAVVTVNSGSGVVAYASVTDQQTNDPTTINMKW